jgi:hypothetical protein
MTKEGGPGAEVGCPTNGSNYNDAVCFELLEIIISIMMWTHTFLGKEIFSIAPNTSFWGIIFSHTSFWGIIFSHTLGVALSHWLLTS